MCSVCGCGRGETRIDGFAHEHRDENSQQSNVIQTHSHHHHDHNHDHAHASSDQNINFSQAFVPGLSRTQTLEIEQNILSKNDEYAKQNTGCLKQHGVLALNLVSSPGSGKTTLLTATIKELIDTVPVSVIEGDQETANDAERIRATGANAIQINTGRGCHLDAHMVGHALEGLPLEHGGVLFIENVGNLVCPANFALGEDYKVAILSVTEGEDKPLKYPDMFAAAQLMILNKIDLLPYVDFDVNKCIEYAKRVNPTIEVLRLSARCGEGVASWIDWINAARAHALEVNPDEPLGASNVAHGHAA